MTCPKGALIHYKSLWDHSSPSRTTFLYRGPRYQTFAAIEPTNFPAMYAAWQKTNAWNFTEF